MGWKPPSVFSKPTSPSLNEPPPIENSSGLAIRTKTVTSTSVSQTPSPSFVSLWILTPGLRYSATNSSKSDQAAPDSASNPSPEKLAMKVFWNVIDENAAVELQGREDTEELSLPVEAIGEVVECLSISAGLLPPSARKFQKWNVGLLERYDELP